MRTVIDTSSLLALVRYYIPFDNSNVIYDFLRREIECDNIIIIKEVYNESSAISKGIIHKKFDFLTKKQFQKDFIKDTEAIALNLPNKFYNLLKNNFEVKSICNKLTTEERQSVREKFLKSADCRMIIYAKYFLQQDCQILTEETITSNDNKLYHKIPKICKILQIPVLNLSTYIQGQKDISFIISSNLEK